MGQVIQSLGPGARAAHSRAPWGMLVFLTAIFFMIQHNPFRLIVREEKAISSAEDIATVVAEGSLLRQLGLLSLGLFGIVGLLRKGRNRFCIRGFLGWLILVFFLWAFLSLAWAGDAALTFRRLIVLAMLSLGALAVTKRFSTKEIAFFGLLSAGLYLIIGVSGELAFGKFRPWAPGYRFAGTLHPNNQGINCAILVLSGVAIAQANKHREIFPLACALIGLIFLILTGSRTAFVSTILALFACWCVVLSGSRKFASLLCVSVTSCLLVLVVGDAFFPAIRQGILLGRRDATTATLTGRVPIWKHSLEYLARRPFAGYGYNSFWTSSHVREISHVQLWGVGEAHSAYLDLLLGLGLVGMVTWVLIFVVGIGRSFAYYRASSNTGYAFLGVVLTFCLLHGFLESSILEPIPLMFLSMVALGRLGFNCCTSTRGQLKV